MISVYTLSRCLTVNSVNFKKLKKRPFSGKIANNEHIPLKDYFWDEKKKISREWNEGEYGI